MLGGRRLSLLLVTALCAGACRSAPSAAETKAAEEARRADVERALRDLFPEVDGPVTRAAIVRALRASREELGGIGVGLKADAIAAIEAGDFDRGQRLISELLGEGLQREARAKLDAGDPRGALAVLDRAVELAPANPEIRVLRAEASLAVGLEDREADLLRAAEADALAATKRASLPDAWFAAARAALALGAPADALQRAREGMDAWMQDTALAPRRAWRTLADAGLAVYETARTEKAVAEAQGDLDRAAAQSEEMARAEAAAREGLEGELGGAPESSWAWERLAWLAETRGAPAEAQNVALRALALLPDDAALHERLAASTKALGGADGVRSVYASFAAAHPRNGLALWHPARALFDEAVDALVAGEDSRGGFRAAEEGFARCRELEPRYADACRGYEVLCRAGVGWCAYRAKPPELDLARKAFLSMEDVFAGGLAWELQGRIASGVFGLHLVGTAYAKDSEAAPNDPQSADLLAHAARIYDYLHAYQPADVNWANNAGFFNRDAAVLMEHQAQALAEQGKLAEAEPIVAQAREMMETSYRAYVDAANAAPDDARIQNDTGLILTYYLQRDADAAERYLKRSVELAEARIAALRAEAPAPDSPAARELEDVEIVLGDAYQNLGYLDLTMRNDPRSAKAWFEKCLKAPDPRPEVQGPDGYLAQSERAIAGEPIEEQRWGILPKGK